MVGPGATGARGAAKAARAVAAAGVGALVGAGEGGERLALVEALDRLAAGLDAAGDALELGGDLVPGVEGGLQRGREVAGVGAEGEVAGDDDEPAVARAVAQGCELHRRSPPGGEAIFAAAGGVPGCKARGTRA